MAETLQSENQSQRATIDELEIKNRLLNDKLHAQIYQQASSYKEKTMGALNRGKNSNSQNERPHGSTSPLRNSSNGRNAGYGLGNNESAFARSPLQVNRQAANVPQP